MKHADYPDTWITPGRRYLLRNGKRVLVTGPITIRFGPQGRFLWTGIKGCAADGSELAWEKTGRFGSDGGQHDLDIISVAPAKKRKVK